MLKTKKHCRFSMQAACSLGMLYAFTADVVPASPLDLSGSVGYNYRQLVDPDGHDTISNQVRGILNARTYLWQPWLATLDTTISATQDATDFDDKQSTTDSTLLTGDLDLRILPQSSTPFSLAIATVIAVSIPLAFRIPSLRLDRTLRRGDCL